MKVVETTIADVKLITPVRHRDDRGYFSETYVKKVLTNAGIDCDFVQDNHSLSGLRGTIRGLHFQTPPFAQVKLVRVIRGAIFDVAVDLRPGSPSYARHVSATLTAEEGTQILIPVGFAHGFCTLEPNTEVIYKVTDYYSPTHDKGLLWNDPALDIDWPVSGAEAVLSEQDRARPCLTDTPQYFS